MISCVKVHRCLLGIVTRLLQKITSFTHFNIFVFLEENPGSLTAIVFMSQARIELIKNAHPKNEWALMINRCNASLLQWPSALYYS